MEGMTACLWWVLKENLSRASIVEMMLAGAEVFLLMCSTRVPLFPARSLRGPFSLDWRFLTTNASSAGPWKFIVK